MKTYWLGVNTLKSLKSVPGKRRFLQIFQIHSVTENWLFALLLGRIVSFRPLLFLRSHNVPRRILNFNAYLVMFCAEQTRLWVVGPYQVFKCKLLDNFVTFWRGFVWRKLHLLTNFVPSKNSNSPNHEEEKNKMQIRKITLQVLHVKIAWRGPWVSSWVELI